MFQMQEITMIVYLFVDEFLDIFQTVLRLRGSQDEAEWEATTKRIHTCIEILEEVVEKKKRGGYYECLGEGWIDPTKPPYGE